MPAKLWLLRFTSDLTPTWLREEDDVEDCSDCLPFIVSSDVDRGFRSIYYPHKEMKGSNLTDLVIIISKNTFIVNNFSPAKKPFLSPDKFHSPKSLCEETNWFIFWGIKNYWNHTNSASIIIIIITIIRLWFTHSLFHIVWPWKSSSIAGNEFVFCQIKELFCGYNSHDNSPDFSDYLVIYIHHNP